MNIDLLFNGPRQRSKTVAAAATLAFVVGGLLLVWSAYIHFHLWQSEGYRHIATIGPLFLVQSIAGLILGISILAIRHVWIGLAGLGLAISTVAGFLLSVDVGLFGFTDTWSAPFAHQTFFVELAAIVALLVAVALCLTTVAHEAPLSDRLPG